MNINILSPEELIQYIESGVTDSLPSSVVLTLIEHYEEQIKETKKDVIQNAIESIQQLED